MKKLTIAAILILTFLVVSCGSHSTKSKPEDNASGIKAPSNTVDTKNSSDYPYMTKPVDYRKIARYPSEANFNRGSLGNLPKYDPQSVDPWQMDLRSYNLSALDISDRLNDLLYASFDSQTVWPEKLPEGFNPQKIMEEGVNPGLGIRKLHEQGITGNGVGIAIIDQSLLVNHIEYGKNIKMYEEIHWQTTTGSSEMHGPAVASFAVGSTSGVAPEGNLYYIAEQNGEFKDNNFIYDFTWVAKSIDRILEINKSLPKHNKIRVISISVGWDKGQNGYDEAMAAVERAKKEGIFVVSASLMETYGLMFHGLDREVSSNPDDIASYKPASWWENSIYNGNLDNFIKQYHIKDILLVPMGSRTSASPTGDNDYVFYREGGWSWSIPYIAGLYVLACQVNPDITPKEFWSTALATGDSLNVKKDGKEFYVGKIVNPVKLIEKLKK